MKKEEATKKAEVIEFPKAKVINHPKVETSNEKETFFSGPHKKYLVSLGSVVLVAIAFNTLNLSDYMTKEERSSRALASLSDTFEKPRNDEYEKKLAEKLATEVSRTPASIGTQPSKIDQFEHGFLASKYSLKKYQQKIQEITFDVQRSNSQPEIVSNREDFLLKRQELWPVQFASILKNSREVNKEDQKVYETYTLMSKDQIKVGTVEFELDAYGRLYKMNLSKTVQN